MRTRKEQQAFFDELYLKMYSDLYKLAYAAFRSPDIAQDIVQETFLVAYKKLEDLSASPSPRGWLVNTLKNVVGNTYKQQAKLTDMFVPLETAEQSRELQIPVRLQYRGLIDEGSLQLLVWIYCEKWSYQEAADELGLSLAACKKRIQRAKAQLKAALEEK